MFTQPLLPPGMYNTITCSLLVIFCMSYVTKLQILLTLTFPLIISKGELLTNLCYPVVCTQCSELRHVALDASAVAQAVWRPQRTQH